MESGLEIEEQRENVCDTLLMCIVTTLNQGLRNGGGIGDVLRAPSKVVCLHLHTPLNVQLFIYLFPNLYILSQYSQVTYLVWC